MHPEIALAVEVLTLARIEAARGCPDALGFLRLIAGPDYTPPPGSDAPPWVGAVVSAVSNGETISDAAKLARCNSALIYKYADLYPQLAEAIELARQRRSLEQLSLRKDKPRRRRAA